MAAPRDLADLVHAQDDGVVGIALRAVDTAMSGRRSAMCLLGHEVQSASAVSLFTARRVGAAGRNGNPAGTYICADLDCAHRAREVPPTARHLDDELQARAAAERAEGLRQRLRAFSADVLRR